MTEDCKLCGQPCLESHDLFRKEAHRVCYDEWCQRKAAGLCDKCGINKQNGMLHCDDCGVDSGFVGYPGP